MNLYPKELLRLAAMCDALNKADGIAEAGAGEDFLTFGGTDGIPVTDQDGTVLGQLVDEVGGSWAFRPASGGVA